VRGPEQVLRTGRSFLSIFIRGSGHRTRHAIHGVAHAIVPKLADRIPVGSPDLPITTVLLADLPPMLEDMMSSVLKGRSDLRVIRGATNDRKLINDAAAAGASVVVVARRNPVDLESIDPYLANAANVSVVALALDGTSACLHAFKPTGQLLEDVSAEQIFTAIEAAAPMGRA